jgi:hypothetical protein
MMKFPVACIPPNRSTMLTCAYEYKMLTCAYKDKMMIMMGGRVLVHMEKCLSTNGKGNMGDIMGTSSPPKEYLRIDRSLGWF